MMVNYFSDNFQLLYSLERLKELLVREWREVEWVRPCFQKVES